MGLQPRPVSTLTACDVCGATAACELYNTRDRLHNTQELFTIAACQRCGVLRTLPEMSEAELARFYPEDYWGEADEPSVDWIKSSQSEKTRLLAACGLTGGRILDVGCGSGFFLRALDQKSWDRFGVEIGEAAALAASRALGEGQVIKGTLGEASLAESSFDVVTFWSALEHTNSPRGNLTEARRVLKQGGALIVQVPNAASYQARWFRGNWFALDAPRHRYHFTSESLGRLLEETGFSVFKATFFSKAHNAHALRQSLKSRLYNRESSAARRALFLLSIPLIKPFDWVMSATGAGATLTVAARAV